MACLGWRVIMEEWDPLVAAHYSGMIDGSPIATSEKIYSGVDFSDLPLAALAKLTVK